MSKEKISIKKYMPYLKNRFILAGLLFLVVLFVFEEPNLIGQFKMQRKLSQTRKANVEKERQIEILQERIKELTTNPEALEKFARETCRMKKNSEVVYLFVEEKDKPKP